jgi:hypothetical protein
MNPELTPPSYVPGAPDPMAAHQAEQLFSLKEWMADISRKLDRMEIKLDGKADQAHVSQLEARVANNEKMLIEAEAERRYLVPQHGRMLEDVGVLKQKAAAISSVDTYKRWVWGTAAASMVSSTVALLSLLRSA